ncbi:MAG: hypothetical protein JNK82_21825 [Myxococcaceae bacterium]|nr:hypothetical protein [Myxococcaceae bacterium]
MNPRQDIEAVRAEALGLHKKIIDAAMLTYEARKGAVLQPAERLRLLASDPDFAWIHPLTKLILEIDDRLESEAPVTAAEAAKVRADIDEIFGSPNRVVSSIHGAHLPS